MCQNYWSLYYIYINYAWQYIILTNTLELNTRTYNLNLTYAVQKENQLPSILTR